MQTIPYPYVCRILLWDFNVFTVMPLIMGEQLLAQFGSPSHNWPLKLFDVSSVFATGCLDCLCSRPQAYYIFYILSNILTVFT
jgi:hypothetical protein